MFPASLSPIKFFYSCGSSIKNACSASVSKVKHIAKQVFDYIHSIFAGIGHFIHSRLFAKKEKQTLPVKVETVTQTPKPPTQTTEKVNSNETTSKPVEIPNASSDLLKNKMNELVETEEHFCKWAEKLLAHRKQIKVGKDKILKEYLELGKAGQIVLETFKNEISKIVKSEDLVPIGKAEQLSGLYQSESFSKYAKHISQVTALYQRELNRDKIHPSQAYPVLEDKPSYNPITPIIYVQRLPQHYLLFNEIVNAVKKASNKESENLNKGLEKIKQPLETVNKKLDKNKTTHKK